jgi:hypothetical protein
MTASDRQLLNLATPANTIVDLARRVSDAATLQCAGRVATSHVRLVQQPQAGDTLLVEAARQRPGDVHERAAQTCKRANSRLACAYVGHTSIRNSPFCSGS